MNRTDSIQSVLRQKGHDVFSIPPGTSVYDALALMAEKEVGALLVMEDNHLRGIVSERDYARKVILQGRSSKDTGVVEIMSDELITVPPDQTVDYVMKLMTEYRVRHVPVMDGRQVIGVVSMGDLVKYVISAQMEEIEHLTAYIAGGYVV
jgi:CBS domain-containing protein